MTWNDLIDELEESGLPSDLIDAVANNDDAGLGLSDLHGATVELVIEGENDERPWHWIVHLADGSWRYIEGWCDNTGWDCQSGISVHCAESKEEAIRLCADDERRQFEEMLATAVQP